MPYTVIGGIGVMTLADNCTMQNPANVMTLDNQVMFCGNATLTNYTAGAAFATLSEESLYPSTVVKIPVVADGVSVDVLEPSGESTVIKVPTVTVGTTQESVAVPLTSTVTVPMVSVDTEAVEVTQVVPDDQSVTVDGFTFPRASLVDKTVNSTTVTVQAETVSLSTASPKTITVPTVTVVDNEVTISRATSSTVVQNNVMGILTVGTDGTLSFDKNIENGVIYLNGIQFTSNSKYYTPEIGNIYNNGTSPLSDT